MAEAVQVRFEGFRELQNKIAGLGGKGRGEILAGVGSEVEGQVKYRIKISKRAPDGSNWKDQAASTQARIAAGRVVGGLNVAGREYQRSRLLVDFGNFLGTSILYQVRGDEVEVGSTAAYAGAIQYGEGQIARPFLGFGNGDRADVEGVVLDYFRGELG